MAPFYIIYFINGLKFNGYGFYGSKYETQNPTLIFLLPPSISLLNRVGDHLD